MNGAFPLSMCDENVHVMNVELKNSLATWTTDYGIWYKLSAQIFKYIQLHNQSIKIISNH